MADEVRDLDNLARTDAELKLLATIIKNSSPPRYEVYADVRTEVTEGAFFDDGLRSVYRAIDTVVGAGEHLNPHTIMGRMNRDPASKEALASVLSYARTDHADKEHIEQYVRHMKQSHVPSRLRDVLSTSIAMLEDGVPVYEVHSSLDRMVEDVVASDRPVESDFMIVKAAAHTALEELRVVWGGDENSRPFIPTPFLMVNELLGGGIYKKHLNLIAARPSVGKTAAWEQIATAMAAMGKGVLVVSLEMTMTEHLIRCAIRESNIRTTYQELMSPKFPTMTDIKTGRSKVDMLSESMSELSGLPIVGVQPTSDLNELTRRIYRAIRSWPEEWPRPEVLILDYIQLMRARGFGAWSRTDEISIVSSHMKALCAEENMAFVPLAQLSRSAEEKVKGELKKPQMKDIKDSGTLEQDAHQILFLHRDIMAVPNEAGRVEAEMIIGKARSGSPGIVSAFFEGPRIMYVERGSRWWGNSLPNPDANTSPL